MSYVRFNEDGSDVYVFLCCYGYLECCACRLDFEDGGRFEASTTGEMLEHLRSHRVAGHTVPESAFIRLEDHAVENDEWIAEYVREASR